ncbi:hypothetical protein [Grimontia sp. NTOU-MAR1]|uniref:hypothetical protein n=1 Tax=Grimontia sp. NTOU-MAR1 TaxID=3111011 RepID=UPI002DB8592D|nr:hypothetical protein [Grimontia sp. NTOU-MAR1]WRV99750.1 hypothetical protein VP504_22440 [Grimontia sp. NTOU-MAR1]
MAATSRTLLVLFLLITLSAFSASGAENPITSKIKVSEVTFEDEAMEICVLERSGDILVNEVDRIYCEDMNISSAKGIEVFTSLKKLDLGGNQLTKIDLSHNTALVELDLRENQLTTIDLSQNTALTTLWLWNSNLTTIDLSQNTELESLDLDENNLTTIDLSQNTALKELFILRNPLATIDLSQNTTLKTVAFDSTVECTGTACSECR